MKKTAWNDETAMAASHEKAQVDKMLLLMSPAHKQALERRLAGGLSSVIVTSGNNSRAVQIVHKVHKNGC